LLDVLGDCPKKYRFWIVEECGGLIKDKEQLTLVAAFFQDDEYASLIAKDIDLLPIDKAAQLSPPFNRDSPLNTRDSIA
jgi:hypothetical protein